MNSIDETPWGITDSADLYRIADWSDRFFHINDDGHAAVRTARTPIDNEIDSIDINTVVQDLRSRGVLMPCLLRFHDVLRARVERVNLAFFQAIDESGYSGSYRGVYPIKVNQLHEVVDEILDAGRPFRMGLECGSKTELVAALPHITDDEILLICNGAKDDQMLELILAAQRLGRNVIPVMEKFAEAVRLLELAKARDIKPWLGVRVRLDTSGSGKWAESGSHLSKFGLSIPELVDLVSLLREREMLDSLSMLHFHIGSQIADVQVVRQAVREITRVYAQLFERGAAPRYLDVGGGLGVNYAAGYSDSEDDSGINYSLQEYANAVVYGVKEICDATGSPCPILVSESGRAMVAHHSVLIVDVLGAYRKDRAREDFRPAIDDHAVIHSLFAAWNWLRGMPVEDAKITNLLEAYHDAAQAKEQADTLFNLGYLEIEHKAQAERLFWSVCDELHARAKVSTASVPSELHALNELLVDQYLCNFSVFQSILDHWAIDQRFPIMPIARLDERPDRRAVLVDLTCDSDGKVDHYVTTEDDRRCLPVHALRDDEPYHLALFLMGAYQDIMGDAHNLFGPVSEAHVFADAEEPGGYYIEKVIRGITIKDMLGRVQYFPHDLNRRMSDVIRAKTASGVLRPRAGVDLLEQYGALFETSTYLVPDDKGKSQ